MVEIAKPVAIPKTRKPGTLHSFFALKFHEGDEDKAKVEAIEKALNKAGITITLMARDVEKWGKAEIPKGKTLMTDYAFPAMQQCDCNIIEFSEKGVGLGINGGYCYKAGVPIYLIAKTGSDISTTMSNLVQEVVFYDKPEDLIEPFKRIVAEYPRVILASKSIYRRQQLIDANIPFEVKASNADETRDESKSYSNQLAEIAKRKMEKVLDETKDRGLRLIIAADQGTIFEDKLYGKPASKEEARELISRMRGSDSIYYMTGNAIALADKDQILQSVNVTDVARVGMENISDEALDKYIQEVDVQSIAGGVGINSATFVHLREGRLSTARGMTLEFAEEMKKTMDEEFVRRRTLRK